MTDNAGRVEAARAEIARRRTLAVKATAGTWTPWGDRSAPYDGEDDPPPPDYWRVSVRDERAHVDTDRAEDAEHIAANDPSHVLAVLAAADATLDRHAYGEERNGTIFGCRICGLTAKATETGYVALPCADALAVLDIYAARP